MKYLCDYARFSKLLQATIVLKDYYAICKVACCRSHFKTPSDTRQIGFLVGFAQHLHNRMAILPCGFLLADVVETSRHALRPSGYDGIGKKWGDYIGTIFSYIGPR